MSNKVGKNSVRDWSDRPILVMGDIHGNFTHLASIIGKTSAIENCYLIVAGDCGFGFFRDKKYNGIFASLLPTLKKNNVIVAFLRGNHDDPQFWDERYRHLVVNCQDHENIQFIEDNSFIKCFDNRVIWCVGGATSVDRYERKEGISWWSGETFSFDYEKFLELKQAYDIDEVYGCITHCGPRPNQLGHVPNSYIDWVITKDKTLKEELMDEQEKCKSMVFDTLNAKTWFHGHWHISETRYEENGCKVVSLDIEEVKEIT